MPNYSHPPIVEATIDIRVAPQPEISVFDLADKLAPIDDKYPHRESLMANEMFFSPAEVMSSSFSEGIRYISEDEQRILQARTDGFTLSVLPPYSDWAKFREEATELWDFYLKARKPQTLTRVALRYINRFELPIEDAISDYLNLHPSFDSSWGDGPFQLKMQFPQTDLDAILLLTQATSPDINENFRAILLDIDLFRDKIPWKLADNSTLWEFLDQLRNRKNQIFESCLTDQSRRLFQ